MPDAPTIHQKPVGNVTSATPPLEKNFFEVTRILPGDPGAPLRQAGEIHCAFSLGGWFLEVVGKIEKHVPTLRLSFETLSRTFLERLDIFLSVIDTTNKLVIF